MDASSVQIISAQKTFNQQLAKATDVYPMVGERS